MWYTISTWIITIILTKLRFTQLWRIKKLRYNKLTSLKCDALIRKTTNLCLHYSFLYLLYYFLVNNQNTLIGVWYIVSYIISSYNMYAGVVVSLFFQGYIYLLLPFSSFTCKFYRSNLWLTWCANDSKVATHILVIFESIIYRVYYIYRKSTRHTIHEIRTSNSWQKASISVVALYSKWYHSLLYLSSLKHTMHYKEYKYALSWNLVDIHSIFWCCLNWFIWRYSQWYFEYNFPRPTPFPLNENTHSRCNRYFYLIMQKNHKTNHRVLSPPINRDTLNLI